MTCWDALLKGFVCCGAENGKVGERWAAGEDVARCADGLGGGEEGGRDEQKFGPEHLEGQSWGFLRQGKPWRRATGLHGRWAAWFGPCRV